MLFPVEYPEFEAAPATPIAARIAAGAISIALALCSLAAMIDAQASEAGKPPQSEKQQ